MLAGADETVREAGAILAGGHTIRDAEPKYGLAVVGTVHPEGIWPKNGGLPGDALFLTKPLGTGIVLQARREGRDPEGALDAAVQAMKTLVNEGNVRPLLPRFFRSLSEAEEENGQSRIYLGIHWSFDKTEGIAQGRRVADHVFRNAFRRVRR